MVGVVAGPPGSKTARLTAGQAGFGLIVYETFSSIIAHLKGSDREVLSSQQCQAIATAWHCHINPLVRLQSRVASSADPQRHHWNRPERQTCKSPHSSDLAFWKPLNLLRFPHLS